tara:strand:+ start:212 stop:583 length:372 start_codon:yes stop_codon:yes gene_type:complete
VYIEPREKEILNLELAAYFSIFYNKYSYLLAEKFMKNLSNEEAQQITLLRDTCIYSGFNLEDIENKIIEFKSMGKDENSKENYLRHIFHQCLTHNGNHYLKSESVQAILSASEISQMKKVQIY